MSHDGRRFFVSFCVRWKWGGTGREFRSRNNNPRILPLFRGRAEVFARGLPRAQFRHRTINFAQNLFCFKLDAMSVPEALATTIRILLMFSIVLVHRWNPEASAHPAPSGTPPPTPCAPSENPKNKNCIPHFFPGKTILYCVP